MANEHNDRYKEVNDALITINKRLDDLDVTTQENIQTKMDSIADAEKETRHEIERFGSDVLPTMTYNLSTQISMIDEALHRQSEVIEEHCVSRLTVCEASAMAPSVIRKDNATWQFEKVPDRDQYDDYLVNKTGCKYWAGKWGEALHDWSDVLFDGSAIVRRVAIRTDRKATFSVYWANETQGYSIGTGYDDDQVTLLVHYESKQMIQSVSTPNLLSRDQYVPFYIVINNDKLLFGVECESAPLLVQQNLSLAVGELVKIKVATSTFGGKALYDCPRH